MSLERAKHTRIEHTSGCPNAGGAKVGPKCRDLPPAATLRGAPAAAPTPRALPIALATALQVRKGPPDLDGHPLVQVQAVVLLVDSDFAQLAPQAVPGKCCAANAPQSSRCATVACYSQCLTFSPASGIRSASSLGFCCPKYTRSCGQLQVMWSCCSQCLCAHSSPQPDSSAPPAALPRAGSHPALSGRPSRRALPAHLLL